MKLLPTFLMTCVGFTLCACSGIPLSRKPALRTVTLEMSAELAQLPSGCETATIWLPTPSAGPYQELASMTIDSVGGPPELAYDAIGNRIVSVTGKPEPGKPLKVFYTVQVTRLECLPPVRIPPGSEPTGKSPWLTPAKTAPTKGRHREVIRLTGREGSYGRKLKALYEHVIGTLGLGKPSPTRRLTSKWGQGDLDWIEKEKVGNSVDFATMLIAYCQTIRIPTSFEIGLLLPKEKEREVSYGLNRPHSWARASLPGVGWVPMDPARAAENPAKSGYYFMGLDTDRILLTRGRDLTLNPPQKTGTLNFFVFPYAEAGGKEITENLKISIRAKDL